LCKILTYFFFENLFFLVDAIWHSSLSCGTLICLLSVGNSFKTCIISVDLGKALQHFSLFNRYNPILNPVAKSIEDILRYHQIRLDTLNTMVKRKYRVFEKNFFTSHTTRPQWGLFKLRFINSYSCTRIMLKCSYTTEHMASAYAFPFVTWNFFKWDFPWGFWIFHIGIWAKRNFFPLKFRWIFSPMQDFSKELKHL